MKVDNLNSMNFVSRTLSDKFKQIVQKNLQHIIFSIPFFFVSFA